MDNITFFHHEWRSRLTWCRVFRQKPTMAASDRAVPRNGVGVTMVTSLPSGSAKVRRNALPTKRARPPASSTASVFNRAVSGDMWSSICSLLPSRRRSLSAVIIFWKMMTGLGRLGSRLLLTEGRVCL